MSWAADDVSAIHNRSRKIPDHEAEDLASGRQKNSGLAKAKGRFIKVYVYIERNGAAINHDICFEYVIVWNNV